MVFICTITITHYDNLLYHEPYCSIVCRQRRGTARFFKEVADI